MGRTVRAAVVALVGVLAFGAGQAAGADSRLDAYEVRVDARGLEALSREGFDMTEARSGGTVEIVATPEQVAALRKLHLAPRLKRDLLGRSFRERSRAQQRPDGSWEVYRPYADPTHVGTNPAGRPRPTLLQEVRALARAHPRLVKLVEIGRSVRGTPILAVKVTRDARTVRDGRRPAVLYSATQHAREWITPEMARRLLHLFVDNYGGQGEATGTDGRPLGGAAAGTTKQALTRLVDRNELWFVVVANPDGYDFTFTPGNRLWRKNLRDNNGDGGITTGDGVDPNRNFPTAWGYDDEGSSPDPASETFRGPGPASEPETRAMDGLQRRMRFAFQVNYHSAAELLLYPHGFQVDTPTVDDPIYRALSGTDQDPAIKGDGPGAPNPYDPDLGAELYITNGETTDHAHVAHGTLAWTPEMDEAIPARGGGASVFEFQDREDDVQAAFEKNVPFALDVARSAKDPANPRSHLGTRTPDFEVRAFALSHGQPQRVEVDAKRELGRVTAHWTVNGRRERRAATTEWRGGERWGSRGDVHYRRLRARVSGFAPGDDVRVWFEARGRRSEAFTFRALSDTGAPVLVLAAEDYRGKANSQSPEQPAGDGPAFLGAYDAALRAAGIPFDVYDVDARGRRAPDPVGVLSHYRAVVWYTGNDLFVREPDAPGATGTSRLAQDEIRAVRGYLNDGGKLLYTGQHAAFGQLPGFPYNPAGEPPYCQAAPGSPGTVTNCVPLSNDFLQYYLGAYLHIDAAGDPAATSALGLRLTGPLGTLPFRLNGPDSAANQEHVYSMVTTSSILDPERHPQFRSEVAAAFERPSAFDPVTGSRYAVARSDDGGYQRLRRTIDLTGVTAAELRFKLSHDLEPAYDFVFVEAHTVGQDDWTTLPDANGHTSTAVGESCDINWDTLHPFLAHYQTNTDKSQAPGAADCTPRGTTGEWNAATGNSGGYGDWRVDLSRFAGRQVEVSITVAQDFAVSGLGAFLDDVTVVKDGQAAEATSFEDGLGGFTAGPAPEGSEDASQWESRTSVGYAEGPGVATADTVYFGFGLEGVSAPERTEVLLRALRHLGAAPAG